MIFERLAGSLLLLTCDSSPPLHKHVEMFSSIPFEKSVGSLVIDTTGHPAHAWNRQKSGLDSVLFSLAHGPRCCLDKQVMCGWDMDLGDMRGQTAIVPRHVVSIQNSLRKLKAVALVIDECCLSTSCGLQTKWAS